MKKKVIIAIIAFALIGIVAWQIIQPPAVECVALENSVLENTFTEIGEVIPLSECDLFTKSGGKLLEVKVAEGAAIHKDELIIIFDGSDLKNEEESIAAEIAVIESQISSQLLSLGTQKNSLESEIASVQIQAGQALLEENKINEDLKSAELLFEAGAISAQELNDAHIAGEAAVKNRELLDEQLNSLAYQMSAVTAQINDFNARQGALDAQSYQQRQHLLAQKAALEIKLKLLREKQSEIEIKATQDGIIRDMPLKEGQILPPGAKLCSIYQPEQCRVDCYILVENIEKVKEGDKVEVTLRLQDEDRKFMGTVAHIASAAVDKVSKAGLNEKRIKAEIIVGDEGWDNVGPYWPVEVSFVTEQAKNCLIAPKTALFEYADNVWKIWVIRDGKAMALTAERGVQTPSQIEIKGDFTAGDIVILNAKEGNISEGKKVRAVL